MEDRELLELAAKAAEINGHHVEDDDWYGTGILFTDEDDCNQTWNPLTDDGDALRLAVKLMLLVTIGPCQVRATSISGVLRGEFPTEDAIYQDIGVATRRAIVRAAAEIGKAMK